MPNRRHVPKALEDFTIKTLQDASVYGTAEILAPTKKVAKDTDEFYIYNVNQQFRENNSIRTRGSFANRVNPTELSTTAYRLRRRSLAIEVYEEDRKNDDPAANLDMDAAEEVSLAMLREKELEAGRVFFTSTAFGTNLLTLSSNAYDLDTTTSIPIDNADTARETIIQAVGKLANGLCIGYQTMDILKRHSDVLDRIKWSERGILSSDLLGSVLGVQNVTVANSIYRSTSEGISATTTFVFNNKLLYYWNDPNPKLKSSNMGVTFAGLYGDVKPEMKMYFDDDKDCTVYELNWMYDVRMTLSLAGYMIAAAHT